MNEYELSRFINSLLQMFLTYFVEPYNQKYKNDHTNVLSKCVI